MSASAKFQEITDRKFMSRALTLARRASGDTSPNPIVGAVLVRAESIIGEGWHHRAGLAHAETEALQD
ncbi:MAG: riboflavin biosynthesis protein RibD, partial [Verrucomicrobia bacterium]|nr:riboflavin biosynthesis protein RibD [Verrucomicrobiota bacterium]